MHDRGMKALLLLALCLLAACGPRVPPARVVISDEFSTDERTVIEDAVEGWCEASGGQWCPEIALWADRGRIDLVDDLPEDSEAARNCPEGFECVVNANNDGDNIRVARNRNATAPVRFWRTIVHELGHYCTEHTDRGLMSPTNGYGEEDAEALAIDAESLAAWREGCGFN